MEIIPVLVGLVLIFLIINSEFLVKIVKTSKKDAEEISPGIL